MKIALLSSMLVLLQIGCSCGRPRHGFGANCWSSHQMCTDSSTFGYRSSWMVCSRRCLCLGHATGHCERAPSECPSRDYPWYCSCRGTFSGQRPPFCEHF